MRSFGVSRRGLPLGFNNSWLIWLLNILGKTSLAGRDFLKVCMAQFGFSASANSGFCFLLIKTRFSRICPTKTDDMNCFFSGCENKHVQSFSKKAHGRIPCLAIVVPNISRNNGSGPFKLKCQIERQPPQQLIAFTFELIKTNFQIKCTHNKYSVNDLMATERVSLIFLCQNLLAFTASQLFDNSWPLWNSTTTSLISLHKPWTTALTRWSKRTGPRV